MKKMFISALLLMFAGCDYEVPLRNSPSGSINQSLLGKWDEQRTDGKSAIAEVKKANDQEYRITYTSEGTTLSFQGYAVCTNGIDLLQLEWLEAEAQNSKEKYLFLKVRRIPEGLLVERLNTEVVSSKCLTPDEFVESIAAHQQNPDLFTEPMKFIWHPEAP
jgi:hypothetical protein